MSEQNGEQSTEGQSSESAPESSTDTVTGGQGNDVLGGGEGNDVLTEQVAAQETDPAAEIMDEAPEAEELPVDPRHGSYNAAAKGLQTSADPGYRPPDHPRF